MLFVATCTDKPDSMAKRLENRPAHLAYLASLGARVKLGGALLTPDQKSVVGSLIVFEAADEAEVAALLAERPLREGAALRERRRQAVAPGRRRAAGLRSTMAHWLFKSEPSVVVLRRAGRRRAKRARAGTACATIPPSST